MEPERLDYIYLLPIFFDGLIEKENPCAGAPFFDTFKLAPIISIGEDRCSVVFVVAKSPGFPPKPSF